MSEEAAGYAELAERLGQLGRVRVIRTGTTALAVVDGDCGSSPAQRVGLTALAAYDAAGYYDCSRGEADDEPMTYPPNDAEEWLRANAWQRQERRDIRDAGTCIAELEKRVTAVETLCADLAMHLSAAQSEIDGLRQNVGNLEHRMTLAGG